MEVIIFDNGSGGVGTITPTAEWYDQGKTIEECAEKDVPQGQAWEIVDSETLDTTAPDELREWI